ncbi:MAG: acetyltransferase [Kiritimatiellae bacterium]|nr:acetyltransferase [Kiritimatiellia bacterium]
MKKIIIIGAGGLGKEIAWVISRINAMNPSFEICGFCDDDLSCAANVKNIAPFLGTVEEVVARHKRTGYICAIGNNKTRKLVMQMLDGMGLFPASVIDPSAAVAEGVQVGAGTYIGINSVVSVGCCLGRGCIVNHNATVGHDVVLGDFAQVCPGVSISGGCVIGEGALLGSNSCTIPGKRMGAWATLGAGAVLLSDLEEGASRVRVR